MRRRADVNHSLAKFQRFMRKLGQRELANLLCSYVMESNHNSWDGHDPDILDAYADLFDDIRRFHTSSDPTTFEGLPPSDGATYACVPSLDSLELPKPKKPQVTVEHVVAMFPDLGGDPHDVCGDPLFPKKTKGEVIEAWIDYLSSLASRDIEQRLDD